MSLKTIIENHIIWITAGVFSGAAVAVVGLMFFIENRIDRATRIQNELFQSGIDQRIRDQMDKSLNAEQVITAQRSAQAGLSAANSTLEDAKRRLAEAESALAKFDERLRNNSELLDIRQIEASIDEKLSDSDFQQLIVGKLLPKGSIVAFERNCPEGWSQFRAADGRFLLGAGPQFSPGTIGGEEEVTLTEAQMPRHAHGLNYVYTAGTGAERFGNAGRANVVNTGAGLQDFFEGEARPHNNMPPYIALYFCKKD